MFSLQHLKTWLSQNLVISKSLFVYFNKKIAFNIELSDEGEVKGKYGYIDSEGIFKETSYGSGAGNNYNIINNDVYSPNSLCTSLLYTH